MPTTNKVFQKAHIKCLFRNHDERSSSISMYLPSRNSHLQLVSMCVAIGIPLSVVCKWLLMNVVSHTAYMILFDYTATRLHTTNRFKI